LRKIKGRALLAAGACIQRTVTVLAQRANKVPK